MDLTSFARVLGGAKRLEGSGANRPTNVSRMTGTAVADSADGKVLVRLDAQVFSGDGSQYVELPTSVNVREGDLVYVDAVGADGKGKSLTVSGAFGGGDRQQEEIDAAAFATTLDVPYAEVEWVESDGHQIVQLDWVPNVAGSFGFDVDFISYNTLNNVSPKWDATPETNRASSGFIFGGRNGSATGQRSTAYDLGMYKGSVGGYMYLGQSGSQYDPGLYLDGRRQQCSYHGTTYTRPDGTTVELAHGSGHPNWGMCVFCLPDNATLSSWAFPSSTRLYSLKFYDGDTLAVDLVGAVRKSDGLTGLWDKVEGRFWPAAGMTFGDVVGDLGEKGTLSEQALANNPIVVDTKTEASRLWTGEAPTIHSLEDGQQITYRLRYPSETPAAGSEQEAYEAGQLVNRADSGRSSNVYLALTLADGTQTEWVPCYYGAGTRLTTHYGVGNDIRLVYHEDQVFGTTVVPRGWWADANYYNNTNNYDRRLHNDNIKAATAITSGHLICGDADGYHNVAAGVSFDLAYPVLYASAAIKANANGKTAYEAMPAINFSTSGTITGGAAAATIWLRGTVSGNVFTVANDGDPYLTCVTPTTRDGFCYIPLGLMTSATAGYFATSSQLYAFLGGYFGPRSIREVRRYITELTDGIMVHPEGDETSGWSIRAALELVVSGVSYIKAWLDGTVPKVRIGREDGGHIMLDPDSIDFMDAAYNVASLARRTGGAILSIGQAMLASGQSAWLQAYTDSGHVNCGIGASHGQSGAAGMSAAIEVRAGAGVAQAYMGGKSFTVSDNYNSSLMGIYNVPMGNLGKLARCRIDIAFGSVTVHANNGLQFDLTFVNGGFDDGNYIVSITPMNLVNGYNNVGWCVVSRTATTVKIGAWNNNSYDVTVNVGVIGVDSRYGTVV